MFQQYEESSPDYVHLVEDQEILKKRNLTNFDRATFW